MIHSNSNNNNSEDDENDVSSQYYAINNDAPLDVMIRPDQMHLRNVGALGTSTTIRGKKDDSPLSFSADSTREFDVENNPSQQLLTTTRSKQQHNKVGKSWLFNFYKKDSLLIDVLLVILIAKIYPRLGAEFLYPEITAHWVAVIVIFCKCVPCVCVCVFFWLET
jgi:hypothetical protein